MPYCRVCRFEYREGVTRCADCGGELLPGPMPEEAAPEIDVEGTMPTLLCRVADSSEVEIICAALREADIPFAVQTTGPITARLALVTDGRAPEDYTNIHVGKNRLEEAQRVLSELQAAPIEWPAGLEPEG